MVSPCDNSTVVTIQPIASMGATRNGLILYTVDADHMMPGDKLRLENRLEDDRWLFGQTIRRHAHRELNENHPIGYLAIRQYG